MALAPLSTTGIHRPLAPPHISLVEATPPRPAFKSTGSTDSLGALTPGSALTHTPSSGPRRHRLLYRGSLSLADSWIPLDGLTFVASAAALGGVHAELLQNPLALALESMRGRPSIHLVGMVKLDELKDVWLDEAGDVSLYIHPEATLTQTYFTNTLCLLPPSPESLRTPYGVRIALGDPPSDTSNSSGSETTEIIVFGRPSHPPSNPTSSATPLRLVVARLAPGPPPSAPSASRAPRPDDPTPRKPPLLYFGAKRTSEDGPSEGSKRRKTEDVTVAKGKKSKEDEEVLKRAREVMLGRPSHLGAGVRAKTTSALLEKENDEMVFKVPAVPSDQKGKKKMPPDAGKVEDPFGSGNDVFGGRMNGAGKKTKGKERAMSIVSAGSMDGDMDFPPPTPDGEVSETESANKLLVKRSAMKILGSRCIDKAHPDFKDLFGYIYRGASFALRAYMKAPLHPGLVDKLVDVHVRMYVDDEIPDMPPRPAGL